MNKKEGKISKCLQQMIKVLGKPEIVETGKKHSPFPKKDHVSEINVLEKPRSRPPLPIENPKSNNGIRQIKPSKKQDPPLNFAELSQKLKILRAEERKLISDNDDKQRRNNKDLGYLLILQDLKFRLIQKGFLMYLCSLVSTKKRKKETISGFLKIQNIKKMCALFEIFKKCREKRNEKRKMRNFLKERLDFKLLSRFYDRIKSWFLMRKDLEEKQEMIIKNGVFLSLGATLKKMKANAGLLKDIREFEQKKNKRRKLFCFQALKSNKISLPSLQTQIKERTQQHDFLPVFLRASVKRKFLKELRTLILLEKRSSLLFKTLSQEDEFKRNNQMLKGKFNLKEIKRIFKERSEETLKRSSFLRLKLACVQRKKTIVSVFFNEMKQKSLVFGLLKNNWKENGEFFEKVRIYSGLTKKKTVLKCLQRKLERKKSRMCAFYLAKSFNLLKKYSNFKKNERNCLSSIFNAYRCKFQGKILKKWQEFAKANKPLNELFRNSLKKRFFKKIVSIFKKKLLLRKYLFLLSEDFSKEKPPKTPFLQLKEILKAWKEQVIESENTKNQKIHNFMASNHRKNTLKFKVFAYWSLLIKRKAAAISLSSFFSRCFNMGVLQKWRKVASFEEMRQVSIERRLAQFKLNVAFQKIKGWFLQRKIIRIFRIKQQFNRWRQGFLFRVVYWPLRLSQMNRKKQVLKSLQRNVSMNRMKEEMSGFFVKLRKKKLFRAFFKELVKGVSLRKKIEFSHLSKQYNVKKKTFKTLLTKVYQRKLREKQIKIADKFHQEQQKQKHFSLSYNSKIEREHVIFKVFSIFKTKFLRKRAFQAIIGKFRVFSNRKLLRNYFELWFEEHAKKQSKEQNERMKKVNLYSIDLAKYKSSNFFEIGEKRNEKKEVMMNNEKKNEKKEVRTNINANSFSMSGGQNENSYASWIKQYEENEKYMNLLLENKI